MGITGFSLIGPAGFEPTTSTAPRYEHVDSYTEKTRVKRDSCEPLHQFLHQISESIKRDELEKVVEAIENSLGTEAFGMLADALSQRAVRVNRGG